MNILEKSKKKKEYNRIEKAKKKDQEYIELRVVFIKGSRPIDFIWRFIDLIREKETMRQSGAIDGKRGWDTADRWESISLGIFVYCTIIRLGRQFREYDCAGESLIGVLFFIIITWGVS